MNKILHRDDINKFAKQISQSFNPDKIILFGSYAWGEPTLESDIDLLIIMDFEGEGYQQAAKIMTGIARITFPVDILVRTHDQIKDGNMFIKEILDKGILLYEKKDK